MVAAVRVGSLVLFSGMVTVPGAVTESVLAADPRGKGARLAVDGCTPVDIVRVIEELGYQAAPVS